jgi:hypothetical protein
MAIEWIGPLFLDNQLSGDAFFAGAGLVLYALLFAFVSARKFR